MDKDFDTGGSSDHRPSTGSADVDSGAAAKSISTACLACRSKHLKCDGSSPCSRCVASGSDCAYVASRRGYKGPGRAAAQNPNKRKAVSPPVYPNQECETFGFGSGAGSLVRSATASSSSPGGSSSVQTPASSSHSYSQNQNQKIQSFRTELSYGEPGTFVRQYSDQTSLPSLAERCFDSFYRNFHAAHPFVLPREVLIKISREGHLEPLLSAIRWVGSLYIEVPSARDSLFDEAYKRVRDPRHNRDGWLLQAMMVLIVAMDGMARNDEAREMLLDAEKLAVEIALNTRPFAILHGRNMPVLEESWRRTWWDLLVIDGMIAGVHRMTNFALFDQPADVALPCEEDQYLKGTIPPPRYLEDLEEQDFTSSDPETSPPFSSFSYRILCARNLGKFMRTPPIQGPDDENLAKLESLLTNWRLHLPASKRDCLNPATGKIDEMMFQGHMMLNATSILLHQPHSQLDSSPAAALTSCAPHQAVLTTGDPFNAHTRHTINSAKAISHLVTIPAASLTVHTHFFTCVLTLSSIVHLSKWALSFVQYDDDDLRQLLRLNVGALTELARVWPAAERARGQVRGVAAEIYQAKKQVQAVPQFWLGLSREAILNSIAADETIHNEVTGYEGALTETINAN